MDEATDVCGQCRVSRAARAIGKKRLERLGRQVIHRLERQPATGIIGDDHKLRSIGDEYCFDQQYGPAEILEDAWDSLLNPMIAELINALDSNEKYLCSAATDWLFQNFDPSHGWDNDLILQGVRGKVISVALDRSLDRFTDW